MIPQEVRLWLTSFPWGQALLRTIEYTGVGISELFLFLSPCRSRRGLFSAIFCGKLVELLEKNIEIMWGPLCLGPFGVCNFQTCPHWANSNSSVSLPCLWFPGQFLCTGLCFSKPWLPESPPSPVLGEEVCPISVLLSLTDPRKFLVLVFPSVQLLTCC